MELTTRSLVVAAFALAAAGGCNKDNGDGGSDLGADVAIGREFVRLRGCATCHQSTDAAAGTLSGNSAPVANVASTTTFAPNLTPDTATGLGGWADIQIIRAIRYGVDDEAAQLCPTMPRFDGSDPTQAAMTDVEANAIVTYLRSLPPVAHSVPESMCPPIKPQPPLDMSVPESPAADMAQVQHD